MADGLVAADSYIIQGGNIGRERLRVLSRAMLPTTLALFNDLEVGAGMVCLDLGCGGGDVTIELARLAAPEGRATGIDIDAKVVAIASAECADLGLPLTFVTGDLEADELLYEADVVYARFILSHLRDPAAVLAKVRRVVRPGGVVIVEDVDFRGHFSYPQNDAYDRYVELYTALGRMRGVDPHIGARVPSLLTEAGYAGVGLRIVQPAATSGDVARVVPLTFAAVAPQGIAAGLVSEDEAASILAALEEQAADPNALVSFPRVMQAWARV